MSIIDMFHQLAEDLTAVGIKDHVDIKVSSTLMNRLNNEIGLDRHFVAMHIGDIVTIRDVGQSIVTTTPISNLPNIQQLDPPCNHEYVDVGFMHSKLVCKHCNVEK
jgi:hypothetical protein